MRRLIPNPKKNLQTPKKVVATSVSITYTFMMMPLNSHRHVENRKIIEIIDFFNWLLTSLLQSTSHQMSSWRSTRTSWLFPDTRSCWAIKPESATSTSAWRRRVWRTGDITCCLTSSSGVCAPLLFFFPVSFFFFDPSHEFCFGWNNVCFSALSCRRFTPEFFQGCSVEETQLHSLQLRPLFTSQCHTSRTD